ncbi:hypothetical protein B0T10DRAFT_490696 [Thelonectria olida]|uniref:Secreted protein CSS2 C-terminal domain-containing protein n=1 Tax=Thelonectria olida TaxID=1576542 RepID=A0A9P8W4L1_9HYPO|nr:hypothetical protein B0T10DRAFT_490696 [Thelonectria olida]
MKFGIMQFVAAMSLVPSLCSGAAMPVTEREPLPLLMPAAFASYELENYEGSLEKRRDVNICDVVSALGACVTILAEIKNVVLEISAAIKSNSDQKKCSTITGYAGPKGDVKYKYRSEGRNCDTTAQQDTIAGAIEHHLKNRGTKLCRTECLQLTHGGTWHGYLLLGPAKDFNSNMYCGAHLSYGHCDHGGKYDLQ